ncbi:MAG: hypothetical protein A3A51_01205 [Candidatus Levybacteria bacterium RIFCSPLOWO2_01_FULL_39_10]|nr:MAG: hypothetical protein A3A51_01205 [Candidatus Levybacteria bacterium RIFCSPLOWO2_01_FULL_39_10]
MPNKETAVLGVDPQNDFCPGGALAVREGDQVIEPLNKVFEHARRQGWKLALSRDWHPEETVHFDKWPIHCVQGTTGAKFHPDLNTDGITVFSKGMEDIDDGYSPFEGIDDGERKLDDFLDGVKRIYVGGLATDYCVRAAVLDAIKREYEVYLLLDAVRAVDLEEQDGQKAIEEMERAGAIITDTKELLGN